MAYSREIVEEQRVSEDISRYEEQYRGFDELYRAVTGDLSQDPRRGHPLPFAPDFRLYRTHPIDAVPAFHILYTFDENKVYLLSIEPVHEDE